MDFEKTSKQIRALDKPEKLKILALLAEEGRKSISAVARELDIHFSTTHKYLEQLEAAELVHSKTVKEDRLKRYFYVKDFDIKLSPTSLTASTHSEKKPETFRVITDEGQEGWFDEKKFTRQYVEAGVPQTTIGAGVRHIQRVAYNYITILELRRIFQEFITEKSRQIEKSLFIVARKNMARRTYRDQLKYTSQDLLKQHLSGDIFITNLWRPRLLNFVHDLHGIRLHGVTGKQPTTLKDLFNQTMVALEQTSHLIGKAHCFNSFNYFISPLATSLSEEELRTQLLYFLENIEKIGKKIYINLDLGAPRYASTMSAKENGNNYLDYCETAKLVGKEVMLLVKQKHYKNIKLVARIWDKKHIPRIGDFLSPQTYVANMISEWQGLNASYMGAASRFDVRWKKWRDAKIGELQSITINLPRIALRTKSEKEFLDELDSTLQRCVDVSFDMVELITGSFLRKSETSFKSEIRTQWDYIHINDSRCSIALVGLNEAIQLLTKSATTNCELAEKILIFCKERIDKLARGRIRIDLKEEQNQYVADRFYLLDSRRFNVKLNKYSLGAQNCAIATTSRLHKYLLGGACVNIKKEALEEFFKNEGGLALVQ